MEYQRLIPTGDNNYKKITESTILNDLEDLLRLFQDSFENESHIIKIIKKYLLDSCHEGKSSTTMNSVYHAITSYFEKNEATIRFRFNSKTKYDNQTELESEQNLSLEDFMKILTVGRPSLLQKAVFLCKFHRGLDSSTLADRFNFEAWSQLVKYFGTEQYMLWDLEKCPVPIKLVRIKRRDEVFRLYFDYGLTASRIGDIMKVNRKTISKDIRFWHDKLEEEWGKQSVVSGVMKIIHRQDLQRTRLRTELEKQTNSEEKRSWEKLIMQVESNMANYYLKLSTTEKILFEFGQGMTNRFLKNNNISKGTFGMCELRGTSHDAREKIDKILKEDTEKLEGEQFNDIEEDEI